MNFTTRWDGCGKKSVQKFEISEITFENGFFRAFYRADFSHKSAKDYGVFGPGLITLRFIQPTYD
jgi:hypothetical protein